MKANLLRAEFVANGKIIAQVAKEAGLARNSLSAKLNGKTQFNTDEVVRICEVINITDPAKKVDFFSVRSEDKRLSK